MLKNHPKGLFIAALTNMGERFGFYTMMAALLLFLEAKFNLSSEEAGSIYSTFYFLIYVLALAGGFIADRFIGLSKTVGAGLFLMLAGYLVISVPGLGINVTLLGLLVISLGNGMFKGNLQAMVGNMYDPPQYKHLRDSAFSVFYMCINIGAFFAPHAAVYVRNWWLDIKGFTYDGALPAQCHKYLEGGAINTEYLQQLANGVSGAPVSDLATFSNNYLDAFNTGYHFAFAIAAASMLVSFLVFVTFGKKMNNTTPQMEAEVVAAAPVEKMSWADEKQRLIALGLVFLIVIFFWMSFHQNGVALTLFARDYTVKAVSPETNIFFNLPSLLCTLFALGGAAMALINRAIKLKLIGLTMFLVGAFAVYQFYGQFLTQGDAPISPELFQQFNALFIVMLTPFVVGFFSWLNKRGCEPSAPRKIGIGMFLAAFSFVIILIGSLGVIAPKDLENGADPGRVSSYWLIVMYFSLTISELFLSPMGISFVSKVAPPRFKGLMQGGWLCATALGNKLLIIGTFLWVRVEIWQVWAFFAICCTLSGIIIFSLMKRLEKVA